MARSLGYCYPCLLAKRETPATQIIDGDPLCDNCAQIEGFPRVPALAPVAPAQLPVIALEPVAPKEVEEPVARPMARFVRILTDDQGRTRFTAADGSPVHGVKRAVIEVEANRLPVAHLDILSTPRLTSATADFRVVDPLGSSTEMKSVRRIEFADGSVFEAEEAA